jgi:hypothetical protein
MSSADFSVAYATLSTRAAADFTLSPARVSPPPTNPLPPSPDSGVTATADVFSTSYDHRYLRLLPLS